MENQDEYTQLVQFGRFRLSVSQLSHRRDASLMVQPSHCLQWEPSPISIEEMQKILRMYDSLCHLVFLAETLEVTPEDAVPF